MANKIRIGAKGIKVYKDPITCQKLEGEALILRVSRKQPGSKLVWCFVEFDGDIPVMRLVNPDNC